MILSFVKICKVKSAFSQWQKCIFIYISHIYCLSWVKFCLGDVHIMVLNICEFHENQPRGGPTFTSICVYHTTI